MDRLDQSYLNDLIARAQTGSSNAFAELFLAVSDHQYTYLMYMLRDKAAAEEKLREVFIHAYKGFSQLRSPALFMSWISGISCRLCEGTDEAAANLPLAEAQVRVMHLEQGLSVREIAGILNQSRATIRRRLRMGERHLAGDVRRGARHLSGDTGHDERHLSGDTGHDARYLARSGRGGERRHVEKNNPQLNGSARVHAVSLDDRTKAEILSDVFRACAGEPNTAPLEALSSYTVYRSERFLLQRGILIAAMILFLLLPVLFVTPACRVSLRGTGERGLPVCTVSVQRSVLPVAKVTARMRNHPLPVYEAGSREFTVEPIRNGELVVHVELLNHQSVEQRCTVSGADEEGPEYLGTEAEEDSLTLLVQDAGIGVDYRSVYAVDASGVLKKPLRADEEQGIVFEYPDGIWDVYVPDYLGNTLHLAIRLA